MVASPIGGLPMNIETTLWLDIRMDTSRSPVAMRDEGVFLICIVRVFKRFQSAAFWKRE